MSRNATVPVLAGVLRELPISRSDMVKPLRSSGRTAADPSRRLEIADITLIKGMILRGDLQSDIAAFFGINGGRIAEINRGQRGADIRPASDDRLPPPGPYLAARSALRARETLFALRDLIQQALDDISLWEGEPGNGSSKGGEDA